MKTIQIELSDQQFDVLENISKEHGKSISELVNVAVEQFLSIKWTSMWTGFSLK
jgi:hypothetical protein